MSKKTNSKLSNGEFIKGVKIIEKEPFREEYNKIIKVLNASKNNPAVIVTCIFCKGSAVETKNGYVCPKCGHKPFKGINIMNGYFTCRCGLLVEHESESCQACKIPNPFLERREEDLKNDYDHKLN